MGNCEYHRSRRVTWRCTARFGLGVVSTVGSRGAGFERRLGRFQSIHADLGADTLPERFSKCTTSTVYFPFPTFTPFTPSPSRYPIRRRNTLLCFLCSFHCVNERSVGRWLALETQRLIMAAAGYIASISPLTFLLFITFSLRLLACCDLGGVTFVLSMLDTLLYGITAWRW